MLLSEALQPRLQQLHLPPQLAPLGDRRRQRLLRAPKLLLGRLASIGLLLPALASLVLIYLTFFLSLTHPYIGQSYLQAGVLGAIYFAVAMFVQRVSRRLHLSEILAREQAASLASMEQLNQLIIQRMRTGILVVSDDQRVVTSNEACAQMLGRELPTGSKLERIAPELEQRLRQWQPIALCVRRQPERQRRRGAIV